MIENCSISSQINLDEKWSRDDVSTRRIIYLLIRHDAQFEQIREGSSVIKFNATLLSEGRAFVSRVYKITIDFSNEKQHSCILKVPHVWTWKDYADRRLEEFPNNRFTNDEMDQVAVGFHSTECEFYWRFKTGKDLPFLPNVYYMEKINAYSDGLILMENLADSTHPLGFYASATKEQLFSVAIATAQFQFYANKEELKDWWSKKVGRMYLDLFVDEFQLTGFIFARKFPELIELLDHAKCLFSHEFVEYSLVDRPKEYCATGFNHGDCQPNNILFEVDSNGQVTDRIRAIIDWQLIFAGNPLTDLTKFMICSVDSEIRKEAEHQAFDIYYSELKRLHGLNGRNVPFTYEQGYELYMLSIGQQIGAMVILMLFVEKNKHKLHLNEANADLFSKRIIESVRNIIPVIEKYGWKRFENDVDLRKYM